MQRQKQSKLAGRSGIIASFLVFAAVLAILFFATANLSRHAGEEGVAATRDAIERAAVLCYATEGFYPPGLAYIEAHYGVQVDHARFAVRYEVYASNIMPLIQVVGR